MGRKNNRAGFQPRPLPADGATFAGAVETHGPRWACDVVFLVRPVGAQGAKKYYTCPGCNQNIPPGVAHVVAWPKEWGQGADDRRHWHRGCWDRR